MKVFELESGHYKLIKKLDVWLIDNMHTNKGLGGEDLIMELKETISKIKEKGYYNSAEKQLLNKLRSQYVESEIE
jgi:hypothetical protein|tara:strand:+ start:445 stop:669 length:225 start_codon:yes stop_codon:yes gene_type:complete